MKESFALRRALCWLCVFAIAASMAQTAEAVNKYQAVPLSDDGLGSTVRALTKVGVGTLGIVGNLLDGSAMYWRLDPDAGAPNGFRITATGFGGCAGSIRCTPTGIAFESSDPDRRVIVGYIDNIIFDRMVAVVWRPDSAGHFTNTILDDQAEQSRANGVITLNTPLGLIIVVCGRFQMPNGDWHACLWRIDSSGIHRVDLGITGRNSEANSIIYAGTGLGDVAFLVGGQGEDATGRRRAANWIVELAGGGGLDWFSKFLPTPPGAESNAVYIAGASGGVWKTAGLIKNSDGTRSACVWRNQGSTPSTFVSQLYRDVLGRTGQTVANGILGDWNGDLRDDIVVGTARTAGGMQRGVGALPLNSPFDAPFPFDVLASEDPVLHWNAIALNAVERGGAIGGEALINGSTIPQAIALIPARIEAPDWLGLVGSQSDDILIGGSATNLLTKAWQEDGSALNLRARQTNGRMQAIMAEWTSASVLDSSRAPGKLTIVSRVLPTNANPTADLMFELQLYDSNAGQWVAVANRMLTAGTYGRGTFFRLDIDVPNPAQFDVAVGAPLLWRTGLRGEDWREWGIDLMEMKTMPMAP